MTNDYRAELKRTIGALTTAADAPDTDARLRDFLGSCDTFLADALADYRAGRGEVLADIPEYASKLRQYDAILEAAPAPIGPVPLFGSATEIQARSIWRRQLTLLLEVLDALLDLDEERLRKTKFLWWREMDYRNRRFTIPMNFCFLLREIRKLAMLLTGEMTFVESRADGLLAGQELVRDVSLWQWFGRGHVEVKDGLLQSQRTEMAMWTRESFEGDYAVRLRFRPRPGRVALIFALCATPLEGLDFSVSSSPDGHWNVPPTIDLDPMDAYNHGVHAYHVSAHVPGRGSCHMRKVGNGLRMLSKLDADPCNEADRWYQVELVKAAQAVMFFADGRLIHHYVDTGTFGPVLSGGHVGIKPFAGGMDPAITPAHPAVSYDGIEIRSVTTSD